MKTRFRGIILGIFLTTSTLAVFMPVVFNSHVPLDITDQSFEKLRGDISSGLLDDDLDPLVDVVVTVKINEIRSLVKSDLRIFPIDYIDLASDPDFYVKVIINNEEFTSPIWENQKYIDNPEWSASLNVPDDTEFVNVTIQLWDSNSGKDTLCDISDNVDAYPQSYDVDLFYSIKSGHWYGDDYISHGEYWEGPDPSGYGRLNGCDDNSIYQHNKDCEVWFEISQNDFDNDGIPYWTEVNIFKTDPTIDNTGEDADNDGIPIEWEYKWGHYFSHHWWDDTIENVWEYDPFIWDDHGNIDDDIDGLDNLEEYLTSQWGSDPFRKDLFVEIDQMGAGSNGEPVSLFPEGSKDILRTIYDKHNIVYHLDDGCMGGGEMIPFIVKVDRRYLSDYYYTKYFLHNNETNWRQGIFHYGLIVYDAGFNGFAVRSDTWQISTKYIQEKCQQLFFVNPDIVYASVFMHETGHSLDIHNPGVDNRNTLYPWHPDYWKYRPYKSCMNYGYTYILVDYSDGSRGMNDFDDWNQMDLTFFDSEW